MRLGLVGGSRSNVQLRGHHTAAKRLRNAHLASLPLCMGVLTRDHVEADFEIRLSLAVQTLAEISQNVWE